MKKLSFFLLIALGSLLPYFSYAFLDGDFGIDMYKKIDEGMTKMTNQNYLYELTGQGKSSIQQEVNRRLKLEGVSPCLGALTVQDIKDVKSGNVEVLKKKLNNECLGADGSHMSIEQITGFVNAIQKVDGKIAAEAENKTKKTYELTRIGLYSDGNPDNSPFDTVNDIQDIDKIIFCDDSKYNGVPQANTDQRFVDLLKGVLRFIPGFDDGTDGNSVPTSGSGEDIINPTSGTITPIGAPGSIISPYVCSDNINSGADSSGLDPDTIQKLLDTGSSVSPSSNSGFGDTGTGDTGSGDTANSDQAFAPGDYKPTNDNNQWECNEFFCIKIEFRIKNYKLLGAGKSVCIKSILESTNAHLKKFAGTSLIQGKIPTNNFELGLMNVDLGSLLHLGIQVLKQPAPILNLEKTGEDRFKDSEFSSNNLLTERYTNLGWEYKRKNDLGEYQRKTEELKSIMGCGDLNTNECLQKVQNGYEQRVKAGFSEDKNSFISKAITERSNQQDANDYFKEFTEIATFGTSMRDFTFNLFGIVKKMNEIPQNN